MAGTLLWLLAFHLFLTAAPGVAAALVAARLGLRRVPVLLAIGLLASGCVAMLSFWAYYVDPLAGEAWLYLALLGSALLSGWSLYGRRLDPDLLRQLAVPLGLWALGSGFILFLGFLHGGTGEPLAMSGVRFSAPLPPDNVIPAFFSDWFIAHGHNGLPPEFSGNWLASDRPPLQIGYVLSQRALGWGSTGLHYEVLGVVLQQLWIVGLWALLLAARIGRTSRALAMLVVLASDLVIVNGFYVWPKLLPAAFLLAAAALVLTPEWRQGRRDPRVAVLVGGLLALAMLGHGASVFGAIPLLAVAGLRGLPSWRWVGVALLAAVVLLAPWGAYQKYGDPPGNRLTKWMLGGVEAVDDRSTAEAIVDGYREVGFGGALHDKGQNFVAMAGGGAAAKVIGEAASAFWSLEPTAGVRAIRYVWFYNLLPSLGLLLLGPLAMLLGFRRHQRRPEDWQLAVTCFLLAGLGAVVWGLLLFGSAESRAVIHQGSLLIPLLGLCGAVLGLRSLFPRFAVFLAALAVASTVAIYVPWLDAPSDRTYSLGACLLAGAALLGFAVLAQSAKVASDGEGHSEDADADQGGDDRGCDDEQVPAHRVEARVHFASQTPDVAP